MAAVGLLNSHAMSADELWEHAFETGRLLGVVEGLRKGREIIRSRRSKL
jgi:hypothetical protein